MLQVGASGQIDRQRGAALLLAVAAGEDEGHRAGMKGMAVEGFTQGGGQFRGAVIIE
jgi:hypothetical protein